MKLEQLLGIEYPLIQAPMAGVQGSALALAVCGAGALGSLPCALLSKAELRSELAALSAGTRRPFNVNFFCHARPVPDAAREAAWRAALAPYYAELGLDIGAIAAAPERAPFDAEVAEIVSEFRPAVVSFHFGLPAPELLARVRGWGAKVLSSATTLEEARWLEAHGADAIIAQGLEAGGHRGMFLSADLTTQIGTFALLPQLVRALRVPVIAAGGIADAQGVAAARAGRRGRAGRHRVPAVSGGDHAARASRRAREPARDAHRAHRSVQRAPGAQHRQPLDPRARPTRRAGARVSRGRRRDRAAARQGGEPGQRGLLAALVGPERERLQRALRQRDHAHADRRSLTDHRKSTNRASCPVLCFALRSQRDNLLQTCVPARDAARRYVRMRTRVAFVWESRDRWDSFAPHEAPVLS
jgi:hypothetical protein